VTVLRQTSEDGSEGSPTDERTDESKRRLSKEESSKEKDGSPDEARGQDSSEDAPAKYPRGVLIYHKTKKGPKKVVRWKQEKDLETIKYFELDETERGKHGVLCLSELCGFVDTIHSIMLISLLTAGFTFQPFNL
jgi:hypothetical protein